MNVSLQHLLGWMVSAFCVEDVLVRVEEASGIGYS